MRSIESLDFRSIDVSPCRVCGDTAMCVTSAFVGEAEAWIPYALRAESLRIAAGFPACASAVLAGALGPRPCPSCDSARPEPRPASNGRVIAMAWQAARAASYRMMIGPDTDLAAQGREAHLLVRATVCLSRDDLRRFRTVYALEVHELNSVLARYQDLARTWPLPVEWLREFLEFFPITPCEWEKQGAEQGACSSGPRRG